MAKLPPGPFRAPIDTAIPAELKHDAAVTESYHGEGDTEWMQTEYTVIKSGGRANHVRDIPEPLSADRADYPLSNDNSVVTDK